MAKKVPHDNGRTGRRASLPKDTPIHYHGNNIVIPAGTLLIEVMGGLGPSWAVASEALIVGLTGDTHTPKYYYAFLPDGVEVTAVVNTVQGAVSGVSIRSAVVEGRLIDISASTLGYKGGDR